MRIQNNIELTYTNGYITVAQVSERPSKETSTLEEYNRTLKTFASVTGALTQCKEYGVEVETFDSDKLLEELKLEASILSAKKGKILKSNLN